MFPKIPSCHYMLLIWPSRLKFISNQLHALYTRKQPLPPGNNPIAVNNNKNNNNNNYYYYYYYYKSNSNS
jgi:hypothetical protein